MPANSVMSPVAGRAAQRGVVPKAVLREEDIYLLLSASDTQYERRTAHGRAL